MKIFAALLSAVTLLLLSCQKERDFARENSSADATGSLLVKIITKHGTDSAVHVYSYNSSGKLVDMELTRATLCLTKKKFGYVLQRRSFSVGGRGPFSDITRSAFSEIEVEELKVWLCNAVHSLSKWRTCLTVGWR